jgi:5-oxoprolinase (ATP-hydrolysing)
MTNTRITDAEILERRYPVMVHEFSVRSGSGGAGQYRGGDGVVRDLEFLKDDMSVGILSERRSLGMHPYVALHSNTYHLNTAPHGLHGGLDGARGRNELLLRDGRTVFLGGKNVVRVKKGDRVRILTPGGGGYGAPKSTNQETDGTSLDLLTLKKENL